MSWHQHTIALNDREEEELQTALKGKDPPFTIKSIFVKGLSFMNIKHELPKKGEKNGVQKSSE